MEKLISPNSRFLDLRALEVSNFEPKRKKILDKKAKISSVVGFVEILSVLVMLWDFGI